MLWHGKAALSLSGCARAKKLHPCIKKPLQTEFTREVLVLFVFVYLSELSSVPSVAFLVFFFFFFLIFNDF